MNCVDRRDDGFSVAPRRARGWWSSVHQRGRLAEALRPLAPYLRGAPPGLPFEWSASTLRHGLNFTLTTRAGDLDLLGEIVGGGEYDALLPSTVEVTLFEKRVRCLDLRTLIAVKRAAGRPKDFEAIAELEAIDEETSR